MWAIDEKNYLKKMIALLLSLKFILSKLSGYYLPFGELCAIWWAMNAIFAIHALILFFWDYIWKHFNFVSTIFIIFQGYVFQQFFKKCFHISFNIFIYIFKKQNHKSLFFSLFVKILSLITKLSRYCLFPWQYLSI